MNHSTRRTFILTGVNTLNRFLSFFLRIMLVRLIGSEAIGLWQMLMPLFFLFSVIASAGMPLAVSRLTAKQRAGRDSGDGYRILTVALTLASILGITAALVLIAAARILSRQLLTDPRLYPALLLIAPSLPVMAVAGVLRGYYQGLQKTGVVAGSLLTEELTQVAVTLVFVRILANRSPETLVLGLAWGVFCSEVAGLLFYLSALPRGIFHTLEKGELLSEQQLRPLLSFGLPATANRLCLALGQLAQSLIIPAGLRRSGWNNTQTAAAYGELGGMALNLLFLPSLFTTALAVTLLPQITTAVVKRNLSAARHHFLTALQQITLLSLPVAALFIALGRPLGSLLFKSEGAGILLSRLACGGLFLYTQHVSSATLQALGKPLLPLAITATGAFANSCLLLCLTPFRQMDGVAVALVLGWYASGGLSLYLVNRHLKYFRLFRPFLLKTSFAAALAGFMAFHAHLQLLALSGRALLSLVGALLVGAVIYLFLAGRQLWQAFVTG